MRMSGLVQGWKDGPFPKITLSDGGVSALLNSGINPFSGLAVSRERLWWFEDELLPGI